jgi:hypothetical protein
MKVSTDIATNPPTAAAGFSADEAALRAVLGGDTAAACSILTSDRWWLGVGDVIWVAPFGL